MPASAPDVEEDQHRHNQDRDEVVFGSPVRQPADCRWNWWFDLLSVHDGKVAKVQAQPLVENWMRFGTAVERGTGNVITFNGSAQSCEGVIQKVDN
jgi:hypothetical protein